MMINVEQKKNVFFKCAGLVIVFFGINLYLGFATDTYFLFANGFDYAARDMFYRNGRIIIALFYMIHYLTSFSNETFYYISAVLSLAVLSLAIFIYCNVIGQYINSVKKNKIVVLSFISIANMCIIEYFMFIEKAGFVLAILFNVLAVMYYDRFLRTHIKKIILLMLVFESMAFLTYQGTVALFVILSLPLAYKNSAKIRDYLYNVFLIGIGYLIPALLDVLAFKVVFKSTRFKADTDYAANLSNLLTGIKNNFFKDSFNIFPPYFWLILVTIVILAAILINCIYGKKRGFLIHMFVTVMVTCILPGITVLQGSGWFCMRVVYPMGSLWGGY